LAVFDFSYACRVAGFLKIANRFLTVLWDASDKTLLFALPHVLSAARVSADRLLLLMIGIDNYLQTRHNTRSWLDPMPRFSK
jgi:hypothetical protein